MSLIFSRTDTSLLTRWWWTVDQWTLGAVLALVGIGVVMTLAASPAVAERLEVNTFHFTIRQTVYLPAALGALFAASLLPLKMLRRMAAIGFIIALAATAATLLVGEEVKGATRWIRFGGFSLQPSEFLKPAFAVVSAVLISAGRLQPGVPGYTLSTMLMAGCAALLLLQPDVGLTLMVVGTWGVQLFLVGLPLVLVGILGIAAAAAGIGAYYTFDHVRLRIDHFLDPAGSGSDGFQVKRALEAFQTGGLFGIGPGEGQVKEVLPDAHADFILAVAGEEFGLVVCLAIVCLYAFVVLRGFARSIRNEDLFVVLAAAGLLAQFGLQALINMASTLHLIPPKGIPLPFVSYGGSSTLALAWAVGMILALTREQPGRPVVTVTGAVR